MNPATHSEESTWSFRGGLLVLTVDVQTLTQLSSMISIIQEHVDL